MNPRSKTQTLLRAGERKINSDENLRPRRQHAPVRAGSNKIRGQNWKGGRVLLCADVEYGHKNRTPRKFTGFVERSTE
jgi:hypothetical protein